MRGPGRLPHLMMRRPAKPCCWRGLLGGAYVYPSAASLFKDQPQSGVFQIGCMYHLTRSDMHLLCVMCAASVECAAVNVLVSRPPLPARHSHLGDRQVTDHVPRGQPATA